MELLEALHTLGEVEIENLSTILIVPRNGEIVAWFSISMNLPIAALAELPAGVNLTGFERWPDQERVLDWRTPIRNQITELEKSGIVGGLNLHQRGPDSWAITTHAGSDSERHKWVMRA